jgi:hypothetical protein
MQEENERVLSGAITESTLRYGLKAARRRVRLREEFVRLAQSSDGFHAVIYAILDITARIAANGYS